MEMEVGERKVGLLGVDRQGCGVGWWQFAEDDNSAHMLEMCMGGQ